MTDEVRQRQAAILDASRALIERAKALIEIAEAARETAQSFRTRAANSRRMSPRHTAELLKTLDRATKDIQMLKARIETASEDALRPRNKQR